MFKTNSRVLTSAYSERVWIRI